MSTSSTAGARDLRRLLIDTLARRITEEAGASVLVEQRANGWTFRTGDTAPSEVNVDVVDSGIRLWINDSSGAEVGVLTTDWPTPEPLVAFVREALR